MPSRLSKTLQGLGVASAASIGSFFVWSKHCHISQLPESDYLLTSPFYHKFNPNPNPPTQDICERRIPLFKLSPELVKDARNGGTKLIETFSQGIWGGFGYTIQRIYLTQKYSTLPSRSTQLWTPTSLRTSAYPTGTVITDHFEVLSKTPQSILLRCGDSPLVSPDGPRATDGLFELVTEPNFERGYVDFKLKSVFWNGEGDHRGEGKPLTGVMEWLHWQYTKLWMEAAVGHCRDHRAWDRVTASPFKSEKVLDQEEEGKK